MHVCVHVYTYVQMQVSTYVYAYVRMMHVGV